ncbi:hypothetical protein D9M72_391940 [compost metagenome]
MRIYELGDGELSLPQQRSVVGWFPYERPAGLKCLPGYANRPGSAQGFPFGFDIQELRCTDVQQGCSAADPQKGQCVQGHHLRGFRQTKVVELRVQQGERFGVDDASVDDVHMRWGGRSEPMH